jgi:phosphatidylglycerophosphate synthase
MLIKNMLKKEFYDIVTVVGFVLIIGISIIISKIVSVEVVKQGKDITLNAMILFQLIVWAVVFIYWLFTLILSINLYEKKGITLLEIVLVAILIPFTPIIYFVLLRKPLIESSENNNHKKKKLGNVPGTP